MCYQQVRKLDELLEQPNVTLYNWKLIVNHPSLWHWKSRFSYIEHVWMQFLHANQTTKKSMQDEFKNINVQGWTHKIPHNHYRSTPDELLRYLRDVSFHYRDERLVNVQSQVDYLDESNFIEQKIEVSEFFLVDLYKKLCNLDSEL